MSILGAYFELIIYTYEVHPNRCPGKEGARDSWARYPPDRLMPSQARPEKRSWRSCARYIPQKERQLQLLLFIPRVKQESSNTTHQVIKQVWQRREPYTRY